MIQTPHEFLKGPSQSLSKLVTPAEARSQPVHRWFLYPHSFSPGLVRQIILALELPSNSVLYDPFAGAGTTLRTAQEDGYSAYGTDLLPLSVLLTNAKIARYDIAALQSNWERLQANLHSTAEAAESAVSDIPLVTRAYSSEVLAKLMHIRSAIDMVRSKTYRAFFMVALARLAGEVSTAVKSGGWLRLVERDIDPASVHQLYSSLVASMLDDVRQEPRGTEAGNWQCYLGSATKRPPVGSYGAVISSPPYLNRHDYTRVLALEHAVVFGTTQAKLIAMRRRLVRSHVEARRTARARGYSVPTELQPVLLELENAAHTDRRVHSMISGYFEDMFLVLRALSKSLHQHGYVAFVLGDVRFAGIMLPVEVAVRQIGEQVGLEWKATWLARTRGNSAQQMKAHGREPAREYVIVWQRRTTQSGQLSAHAGEGPCRCEAPRAARSAGHPLCR